MHCYEYEEVKLIFCLGCHRVSTELSKPIYILTHEEIFFSCNCGLQQVVIALQLYAEWHKYCHDWRMIPRAGHAAAAAEAKGKNSFWCQINAERKYWPHVGQWGCSDGKNILFVNMFKNTFDANLGISLHLKVNEHHVSRNAFNWDASFQAKPWIQVLAIYFQATCFSFLMYKLNNFR